MHQQSLSIMQTGILDLEAKTGLHFVLEGEQLFMVGMSASIQAQAGFHKYLWGFTSDINSVSVFIKQLINHQMLWVLALPLAS